MKRTKKKNLVLWISLVFFLISLTQQSYCTNDDYGSYGSGFVCVVFGVLGLAIGGAFLIWLTNPFLLISWFFTRKNPIVACIVSGISLAIALSFLFFDEIMINEAGHYGTITGYALGYWLWVLSIATVFIGSAKNHLELQSAKTKKQLPE